MYANYYILPVCSLQLQGLSTQTLLKIEEATSLISTYSFPWLLIMTNYLKLYQNQNIFEEMVRLQEYNATTTL